MLYIYTNLCLNIEFKVNASELALILGSLQDMLKIDDFKLVVPTAKNNSFLCAYQRPIFNDYTNKIFFNTSFDDIQEHFSHMKYYLCNYIDARNINIFLQCPMSKTCREGKSFPIFRTIIDRRLCKIPGAFTSRFTPYIIYQDFDSIEMTSLIRGEIATFNPIGHKNYDIATLKKLLQKVYSEFSSGVYAREDIGNVIQVTFSCPNFIFEQYQREIILEEYFLYLLFNYKGQVLYFKGNFSDNFHQAAKNGKPYLILHSLRKPSAIEIPENAKSYFLHRKVLHGDGYFYGDDKDDDGCEGINHHLNYIY